MHARQSVVVCRVTEPAGNSAKSSTSFAPLFFGASTFLFAPAFFAFAATAFAPDFADAVFGLFATTTFNFFAAFAFLAGAGFRVVGLAVVDFALVAVIIAHRI